MSWTMRHRKRSSVKALSQIDFGHSKIDYVWGGNFENETYSSPIMLSDATIQETWDVDRKVHPRDKDSKDYGGPFSSKKLEIRFDQVAMRAAAKYDYSIFKYDQYINGMGTIISSETNPYLTMDPSAIEGLWSSFSIPSSDLAFYGPKAINKVNPTKNVENLPDIAQFITELIREGIPKIPLKIFTKTKSLKGLGSEYLNSTFGWRPLLSDLYSLLRTYQDIERTITQLKRDNGQSVRRSGTLHYSKEVGARSTMGGGPRIGIWPSDGLANVGDDPAPYGPFETWDETEERVWFAGKGSYILPADFYAPSNLEIENFLELIVSVPSPSTIYELIPWSWLIDYFTNLGDVVDNAIGKGVGEYTLDYCYLMRKKIVKTYYVLHNTNRYGYQRPWPDTRYLAANRRTAQCVVTKTTLERIAASPFGFGVNTDGLSGRQWAILTALGLSRQNFI